MLQYFTIYTVAELICFFIAIICLINDKDFNWRMMILFMLVTCMVEMGAIPLKTVYRHNPIPANSSAWIYNILLLIQISAFSFMFYHLLNKHIRSKPLIIGGLALLLVIYIYDLFTFPAGIFNYNADTYSVMSVLFIFYSLYYYYLLIGAEEYADIKTLADFWWVTGTLFFFFGSTACNLFYNMLTKVSPGNTVYLTHIGNVLIIILYSCWSYSFICKRWITSNK
jgi:hypothetical protein